MRPDTKFNVSREHNDASLVASFQDIRKHPTRIALQGLNDPQQFQHINSLKRISVGSSEPISRHAPSC
jgi:hypothetical protein